MARTFDEMMQLGQGIAHRPVTFLPDPEPQPRTYLLYSVDDHVCEPGDLFTRRVDPRYGDDVPHVVGNDDGAQAWLVAGELRTWTGADSTAGRRIDDLDDLLRNLWFADMRAGTYDVHARIRDMDIDGVYATVTFPSMVWGFCGQKIWGLPDPALALACVRAYNDWMAEEWAGPYPDRIIPASLCYMRDPVLAAEEVRRNAARGFKAVHFSENPEKLGLPSIHTRHWEPFFAACEETDTVINLHLGSSSTRPSVSSDTPVTVTGLLWPAQTMSAAADWVYSQVAIRFPRLRIVLSEGGIGWVPMLRERMERAAQTRGAVMDWTGELSPAELLMRNFWFCAIDEPRSMEARHHIGVDRILLEVDYPHSDTSWPHTQAAVDRMLSGLPADEIAQMTHGNAAHVYRHPVPTDPAWAR
ncbi:amidohydrolase family protein [Trujillonella endophytica]|uniref:Amidohydrolase n=1 Tax=Trujillonella endophytica TaxID=673521 RepID=A0A1H8WGC7_9ACTN|nr:amidohydrolase family protein [Trujillella endophytica]SEP26686.1 Amidohydrolase [Trujillella endophytica]